MILLDTHIWIWWANNSSELFSRERDILTRQNSSGLALSIISCWELAKLVELKRVQVAIPVEEWIARLFNILSLQLLDLTPPLLSNLRNFHNPFTTTLPTK